MSRSAQPLHAMPMPPMAMPTLSSQLPDGDDDDEVEDSSQDDGHMVALLEKLKSAKQNIDSSRNKRKTKQLIEQGVERYEAESDELLKKHNKRWAAKFGNMQGKSKRLRTAVHEQTRLCSAHSEECAAALELHGAKLQGILHTLEDLGKECDRSKGASECKMGQDSASLHKQVGDKLRQVRGALSKAHSSCGKDDQFTKMIKTFIAVC